MTTPAENLLLPPSTRYTRVDFMALRYRFNHIAPEVILRQLYHEDALAERGIETPAQLRTWLNRLKRRLVDVALKENPRLADRLANSERTDSWQKDVMEYLFRLGERDYSIPQANDNLNQWFRPHITKTLASDGVETVAALKRVVEVRGQGWYRPIPRIGPGRARAIVKWLQANAAHLGEIDWPKESRVTATAELSPHSARLLPLDRVSGIVASLDGRHGVNRNHAFSLISARNDLDALHAYLYKFRDKPPTHRAYRKELERFLLWCVRYRQIALSDVLLGDCEAFKDFLALPPPAWVGPRASRNSAAWKPFAGRLSPASQRYAVQTIRSCFEWLVNVRYLSGNPWITVADPAVPQAERSMQIDKAIPQALWQALTQETGWLDQVCRAHQAVAFNDGPNEKRAHPYNFKSKAVMAAQSRLARAAILLMGFSGVRREEATSASRGHLQAVQRHSDQRSSANATLWELAILGKRNKWRTVFLPPRVVNALAEHWQDRGLEFFHPDDNAKDAPLLSPLAIPPTETALDKHGASQGDSVTPQEKGFMPDALNRVIKSALQRIATTPSFGLSAEESSILYHTSPHALRHTFATLAAAKDMPLDVLQRLLGHASINTTSIYVQAEKQRSIEEVRKLFGSLSNQG